jgi:hypothetical protein
MGVNARERAIECFLGDRHLEQWAQALAVRDVITNPSARAAVEP